MGSALVQKARVRTNPTKDSVCGVQVLAVEFAQLWASYPDSAPFVGPKAGKPPLGYENQCAIKVSVSIHGVGVEMKSFRGAAEKVNGLPAALLASQLAAWLKQQRFCGLPESAESVTGADGQSKIRGRPGIVYFADYWARSVKEKARDKPTGDHIDLWNGARLTAEGMSFFSTMGPALGPRIARGGNVVGVFGHGSTVRDSVLGDPMIRRVTRLVAGLTFAVLGSVSLVVADVASQWLCARVFACDAALNCPIDTCEGDARLTFLRLAVWVGPAIVLGASAIAFSGRRRSTPAWLALLAALIMAHSLIMVASR